MSHPCPTCNQWCYCDGEDSPAVSQEWIDANCSHDCEERFEDDDELQPDEVRP